MIHTSHTVQIDVPSVLRVTLIQLLYYYEDCFLAGQQQDRRGSDHCWQGRANVSNFVSVQICWCCVT